jgi:hypothetical protein
VMDALWSSWKSPSQQALKVRMILETPWPCSCMEALLSGSESMAESLTWDDGDVWQRPQLAEFYWLNYDPCTVVGQL